MSAAVAAHRSISFAELLRQLRNEAGLTQEELAAAASLSPRSISDLERGINLTARKDTARLLADALGLQGIARTQFEATARGRGSGIDPAPGEPGTAPGTGGGAATRTLPRDIASFTGRETELVRLREALKDDMAGSGVVGIHAIDGMAGIGKTTFAVHAAHLLATRFPDGQIFLRLHGHTPGQPPVSPADALATLLACVGVASQQIPAGVEARAGLWRDRLSGKKVLLVLDDATSSEHVRPLLPGSAGTLVLVTSRRRLAALPEALPITIDILEPGDAAELFVRLVGRPGLEVGKASIADVVRLCGYLPLAISLMAGQLKHHPDMVGDTTGRRARLGARPPSRDARQDDSIAAAFDLSYRELTADQRRLSAGSASQPGDDIDAHAATALDGNDLAAVSVLLDDLYTHHLINEAVEGRYRFHDLIREHARALAAADDPAERDAAIESLLSDYLHAARSPIVTLPGAPTPARLP